MLLSLTQISYGGSQGFQPLRSLIHCKLWILKNGKIIVKTIQMKVSEVMNNVILMNKGKGIKLKSAFLEKCKAAEKQFAKFVPDTTIDIEFVDFLHEKYYLVKDMSSSQNTSSTTIDTVLESEKRKKTGW